MWNYQSTTTQRPSVGREWRFSITNLVKWIENATEDDQSARSGDDESYKKSHRDLIFAPCILKHSIKTVRKYSFTTYSKLFLTHFNPI
jgi:hypothetical protein